MRAGRQHRFKHRERRIGRRFEPRVGDLVLDLRLAVQDHRDAFALEHELDVGERRATVGDEIRRTRQRTRRAPGCGSSPVRSPTLRDSDAGFLLRTPPSVHAFWRVVSRAGSAFGSCRSTLAMFACPSPADRDLHVEARAVGFAGLPSALARQLGIERQRPRSSRPGRARRRWRQPLRSRQRPRRSASGCSWSG